MKRMRRFMALLLTLTLVGSNAVFAQAAGTGQETSVSESTAADETVKDDTEENADDDVQSEAPENDDAAPQDNTAENDEAEADGAEAQADTAETAGVETRAAYQGDAVSVMAGETAQLDSRFSNVRSWSSTDPDIATVDNQGRVTGVAVGRTTVTAANYQGDTQTFEISVSELQYFDSTIFDYKEADNTAMHYEALDGAVYLDDLQLYDAESGWGEIGRGYCGACENDGRHNVEIGVVPDRNSSAVVTYEKGISIHADGQVTVYVPDDMNYFSGVAAVNQCEQGSNLASMEFRVTVEYRWENDETYTYRVGNTSSYTESAEPFCIDVRGADRIVLEVDRDNGANSEDHGVWADAKFTYNEVDQEERMDASGAGHGSINDITYGMDSNTEDGLYFTNGTNRGKYEISGEQNTWTNDSSENYGGVVQGIAASELVGSEIKLNYTEPGLFTLTPNEAKDVFTDISFPFVEDADGYYTFDSTQMTAAFDEGIGQSGAALEFYNQRTEFSQVAQTNGDQSGFFPFNDPNGASEYTDELNYWFGMSMSVDFYMLNGGYMDTAQTEPITFDFSGDDDVWIYIDGKLVLDLGGIHDMATGSINFGTGWITVTPANGETEKTRLSSILEDGWVNDNGIHSLQIFYLERGQGASNLKVKFNLPQKDQLIVEKQFDNTSASESEREELLNKKFTFQLKRGDVEGDLQNYAGAVYALFENGAMIGRNLTTDSEGKFTLKYNQRAVFSLEMPRPYSHYYQVSETGPGEDYTTTWYTSTNNVQTGSGNGTEGRQTFIGAKEEYLRTNVDVYTYTFHNYRNTVLKDDTVVIDYGKEIDIDVFKNDEVYASRAIKLSEPTNVNGNFSGKNGLVAFTPNAYMDQIETAKYNVTDAQGKEQSATVTVIPATTVYYEDDFPGITFSDEWDSEAKTSDSSSAGQVQDDGSVGIGNDYGYDSSYDGDLYYSGGSAHFVSAANGQATASFTFKGTGFDLISKTDTKSAVIMVKVQKGGKTVQNKKLDLEYKSGELYQIPVHEARFDEYGEYTVTITVSAKDEAATFYLDAIRVYNPIDPNGSDADKAEENYAADGEANAEITELRNILLDAESYKEGNADGILYTDGEDKGTAVYESEGPNNEVYLKGGHSVGFNLEVAAGVQKILLGAKAVGSAGELTVGSDEAHEEKILLNTATDMYYDITDSLTINEGGGSSDVQNAIVVITNTSNDDVILSLTNLKVTYAEAGGSSRMTLDDASVLQIRSLAASRISSADTEETVQPSEPEEPANPEQPTWQDQWNNVVTGIKETVSYIGQKIQSWFSGWF